MSRACAIVPRVATDVGHEDIHVFDDKAVELFVAQSDVVAVDVAIDGAKGLERLELVRHVKRADVARVPDFVAILEMGEHARVEHAVGVGKQTYAFHGCGLLVRA